MTEIRYVSVYPLTRWLRPCCRTSPAGWTERSTRWKRRPEGSASSTSSRSESKHSPFPSASVRQRHSIYSQWCTERWLEFVIKLLLTVKMKMKHIKPCTGLLHVKQLYINHFTPYRNPRLSRAELSLEDCVSLSCRLCSSSHPDSLHTAHHPGSEHTDKTLFYSCFRFWQRLCTFIHFLLWDIGNNETGNYFPLPFIIYYNNYKQMFTTKWNLCNCLLRSSNLIGIPRMPMFPITALGLPISKQLLQ